MPLPVPVALTLRVYVLRVNAAVTLLAASIVTVQVFPVPAHAPLQPVKVELVVGTAVRVTRVPLLRLALHVVPQLMPAGLEVTVPVPAPLLDTERAYVVGIALKVAVTVFAASRITVQASVPVQAPPQPPKV